MGTVGAKREWQLTRTDGRTRTHTSHKGHWVCSDDLYEESTGGGGGVPRTATHAREVLPGRLLPRSHLLTPPSPIRSVAERCVSRLHRFLGGFICKFNFFFLFWLRVKFGGLVWGSIGGESCDLCVVRPSILPPGAGNFCYFPLSFYLRFRWDPFFFVWLFSWVSVLSHGWRFWSCNFGNFVSEERFISRVRPRIDQEMEKQTLISLFFRS